MLNQNQENFQSRRQFLKLSLGALAIPALGTLALTGCNDDNNTQNTSSDTHKQDTSPKPEINLNDPSLLLADTPRLATADNFRDLAGNSFNNTYSSTTGLKLRRGLLYRSNALPLSAEDQKIFSTLDIQTVYDLRTSSERTKQPDILSDDTSLMLVNIMGTSAAESPSFISADDSINYMIRLGKSFVQDEHMCHRFGVVLKGLIHNVKPQVFHCAAGKDRTGWTAAILQLLLGVDENTVMQDYLLTNEYTADRVKATYVGMEQQYGRAFADAYLPLLGVQKEFLNSQIMEVKNTFGVIEKYAEKALLLTKNDIEVLKTKMLIGYS